MDNNKKYKMWMTIFIISLVNLCMDYYLFDYFILTVIDSCILGFSLGKTVRYHRLRGREKQK